MGDLSKLKVAVGQPELMQARPSENERAQDRLIELSVEAGADVLVMPGSLLDASDVRIIALNDSRIDVVGGVVVVEAAGESYHVGLGPDVRECDFSVWADTIPWTLSGPSRPERPGIALRPVGMSNVGKRVLAYDGGTAVLDAGGRTVARLRDDFEEDFALVRFGEDAQVAEPAQDKLLAALVKTLRRFDFQVLGGQRKWVIGLSGGLDSSVVAALLVLALGPERVIGYNLASAYNSQVTKTNAAQLAESLGIEMKSGSISALVDATEQVAGEFGYEPADTPPLVLENVQARVRGHLLSTFAALEGGVVANNGNRVECALGYATLYGDAIGALAPIGDLTKVRLFDLARSINGQPGCEVIPENLLPRETADGFDWDTLPSAELTEGQVDPMKWFYHDWLVEKLLDGPGIERGACAVMQSYLDDHLRSTGAAKWVRHYGLDDPKAFLDDLDWVLSSIRASAFKRIQAPPAITIASLSSVDAPPEVQGDIEPTDRFKQLHASIQASAR